MVFKVFFYDTGDEVQAGDLIRFHTEPGRIEFVVKPHDKDPEKQWFIQEFGGGVALESKGFGRVFLQADRGDAWEDLEFVSRAEEASSQQPEASS